MGTVGLNGSESTWNDAVTNVSSQINYYGSKIKNGMNRLTGETNSGKSNQLPLRMNLQLFAKKDIKQVNDVANKVGVDRNEFRAYIHEIKADLGRKASQNFTWDELVELAEELKKMMK